MRSKSSSVVTIHNRLSINKFSQDKHETNLNIVKSTLIDSLINKEVLLDKDHKDNKDHRDDKVKDKNNKSKPKEKFTPIFDLRDNKTHNESDIYELLNQLYKNKQYFIYSGPLLLTLNPGEKVDNYLNLEKWLERTANVPEKQWEPHLYSFINYVYQNLCMDDKDQMVCMLGKNIRNINNYINTLYRTNWIR